MTPLTQRRMSDVAFVLDKNLNVLSGNRSFLRLFNITDVHVQLSEFMSEVDCMNFKYFLENFSDKTQTPYFVTTISPDNHSLSCLFYIEKQSDGFHVDVKELSYSKELLDKALLQSREYTALLQNFDAYYFTYNGEHFVLKNTKDLNVIFDGKSDEFKTYFENNFKINMVNCDTAFQLTAMINDVNNFQANKIYKFFREDSSLISVHTIKSSTRNKILIVGSISTGIKSELVENMYSEKKDGLTDLYNKKSITELAIQKINEAKNPVSLIIMDVDKFKDFNDTFGHVFGDRVLIAVANCIKEAVKGIGIAGRIGGDEFLIILDKTEENDIRNVARNIRMGIQWNITNVDPESVVTCSMGIARFPLNVGNYDDLFKLADKCLYIAKNKGRDCYIIYKPEIHDSVIVNNEKNANSIISGEFFHNSAESELEILSLLKEDRNCNFDLVLEKIVKYMSISTINVYDKDLKLFKSAGKKAADVRHDYFDSKYFLRFNKFGFLHLDNTIVLDTIDKRKVQMYMSIDISSTLEIICNDENGNMKALVCYDIYKPARTFPKEKIIFAILAAKLIAKNL